MSECNTITFNIRAPTSNIAKILINKQFQGSILSIDRITNTADGEDSNLEYYRHKKAGRGIWKNIYILEILGKIHARHSKRDVAIRHANKLARAYGECVEVRFTKELSKSDVVYSASKGLRKHTYKVTIELSEIRSQ